MPIRLRFLAIFILGIGALFLTQRFFMSRVMESAFLEIEKDEASDAILRAEESIQAEINFLETKAVDWAIWDQSYDFITGRNKTFIKANFPDPQLVLKNLKINLMLFLDSSRQPLFSVFDSEKGAASENQVPKDLLEAFQKAVKMESRTQGLISSSVGVFAYSSIPIQRGNALGPFVGQVIFAEILEANLQKKIEAVTHLNLNFESLPTENSPKANLGEASIGAAQIDYLDGQNLRVRKKLIDVFGNPVIQIQTQLPRQIFSTYLETSRKISLGLLIASLLLALAIFYFMSSQVFSPIQQFIRWQKQITDEGSWKVKRFTQSHKVWKFSKGILGDELDELIRSSNLLLDKIEESSSLIEKQAMSLVNSEKYKSLSEMSAGIAHEINNPLMIMVALSGKLQMLLRRSSLDEKLRTDILESLQKMEFTVNRVKKIIDGLLRFARDASQDPFSEIDCVVPIEDGIELVRERIHMQQIELWTHIEKGLLVNARPGQLTQVFYNLLNNSIDEISGHPKPWIQIRCEKVGTKVRIEILDSGHGIPEAIRNKIFNPFFTTKELGKGTGLGLSISVGIIEDHGGSFFLDTERKNTCFVIELPLKETVEIS